MSLPHLLISHYLTRWLESKRKHVSSRTFDGYRKIIEHRLIPSLAWAICW